MLTGVLVLVLDAIATAVLAAAGPERGEAVLWALELGLRVPYLAAAFALFAATDGGRVRMVVERRRSALFAFTAGARFAWRHRAPVVLLYAALFATAGMPWALVSAVELWLEPGVGLARLLDAIQVGARDHRGARQRRRRYLAVPGRRWRTRPTSRRRAWSGRTRPPSRRWDRPASDAPA